jgi:hypothetical protein
VTREKCVIACPPKKRKKQSPSKNPHETAKSSIPFCEVENGMCRWILTGSGQYAETCAQKTSYRGIYCEKHIARAYVHSVKSSPKGSMGKGNSIIRKYNYMDQEDPDD